MTPLPVIIAAVLSMAGAGPILLGTWRGRDNPQVMSWCIWAALPLTGGLAMAGSDYMLPAVNVLAVGVSCALVAVLALRIPAARRDPPPRLRLWPGGPSPRLDLLCLPGAVAGLVLAVVVRAPVPAVVVTAVTDALAFPPTYGHIWAKPYKEPWLSYALYSAGGAVSLTVADWHTPAGWVYPVYLCAGDGAAAVLIIVRRALSPGEAGPGLVTAGAAATAGAGMPTSQVSQPHNTDPAAPALAGDDPGMPVGGVYLRPGDRPPAEPVPGIGGQRTRAAHRQVQEMFISRSTFLTASFAARLRRCKRVVTSSDPLTRPVAGPVPPSDWVEPKGPPLWPGTAGDPPDSDLRWFEHPDWKMTLDVSFLLPDLARITGRAWLLDTLRWTQEQATSMCLDHHRAGCRQCTRTPPYVRPEEPCPTPQKPSGNPAVRRYAATTAPNGTPDTPPASGMRSASTAPVT